jgi:hypothetical protein
MRLLDGPMSAVLETPSKTAWPFPQLVQALVIRTAQRNPEASTLLLIQSAHRADRSFASIVPFVECFLTSRFPSAPNVWIPGSAARPGNDDPGRRPDRSVFVADRWNLPSGSRLEITTPRRSLRLDKIHST